MTPTAQHAILAAENIAKWGRYATFRYLQTRGVPLSLFTKARQLRAITAADADHDRHSAA